MRAVTLIVVVAVGRSAAFTVPATTPRGARTSHARMMFGGGGDKEEGGFMDKLKQAKDMFNPEMMKKYSEVGVKVQQLQAELAQTEVECATADGGVVVKVSGTQVPMSVTVSDELCASGVEKVSAELTTALKAAHTKSGVYAQDKMREMYDEMGLSAGMAGMGGPPPGQ